MSASAERGEPSAPIAIRWPLLDSLRGFALFGVLLVNSLDITQLGTATDTQGDDPLRTLLYFTVQTRFVPIFAFLFGVSLWLILQSARVRGSCPWMVLLRRLTALLATGLLLAVIYPGNILTYYGLLGLIVLPVILVAQRVEIVGIGVVVTIVAYAAFGGDGTAIPALLMLGAGAAAYGVPQALEIGGARVAQVFAVSLLLAIPALLWQSTDPGDPRSTIGGIAGVILAVTYTTGFALLWRTPIRHVLRAVFDPLGRMALSNFVAAAIIVAITAAFIDFTIMNSVLPAVVLTVAITILQSLLSRLWLIRFRYGPLEQLWRAVTWWRPVTARRNQKPRRIAFRDFVARLRSAPSC